MDDDYAHMLHTVGGPDEGNMVAQMQSVVCCQEDRNGEDVFHTETPYTGSTTHLDLTAETQLYESMLHWNDDEVYDYQPDYTDSRTLVTSTTLTRANLQRHHGMQMLS